jgi:hypothetical protein
MRNEPDFAGFLRSELRSVGPGFIVGCLALAGADRLSTNEHRALCLRIMRGKRRRLVASLAGDDAPISARILRKIDPEALTPQVARVLADLVCDPVKAKVVRHLPTIAAPVIWWLNELPGWACSIRLIELASDSSVSAKLRGDVDLPGLLQFVEKNCPDHRHALARALRSAHDGDQLVANVGNFIAGLAERIPFPASPFLGTAELEPLASAEAIRAEGRRMRNCLGGLTWPVRDGRFYFYHWHGAEPATVGLVRGPSGGWQLDSCLGFDNQRLSKSTHAQIEAVVGCRLTQVEDHSVDATRDVNIGSRP